MTELHGSHAASCLASQSGAQATSPMEGMVITTSRLGLWPEGPRTDRYGHAEYEFSYRVRTRNKSGLVHWLRTCGPERVDIPFSDCPSGCSLYAVRTQFAPPNGRI